MSAKREPVNLVIVFGGGFLALATLAAGFGVLRDIVEEANRSPTPDEQLMAAAKKLVVKSAALSVEKMVRQGDPGGIIIEGVILNPNNDRELVMVVAGGWYSLPRGQRLELVNGVWAQWASKRAPENLETARISVLSGDMRRLGGSGIFGSSVTLEPEP